VAKNPTNVQYFGGAQNIPVISYRERKGNDKGKVNEGNQMRPDIKGSIPKIKKSQREGEKCYESSPKEKDKVPGRSYLP